MVVVVVAVVVAVAVVVVPPPKPHCPPHPHTRWLHDVPRDRHLVLGNRVALNTGVLFLRAGKEGTGPSLALLEAWVRASDSIQCHAFDQVGWSVVGGGSTLERGQMVKREVRL